MTQIKSNRFSFFQAKQQPTALPVEAESSLDVVSNVESKVPESAALVDDDVHEMASTPLAQKSVLNGILRKMTWARKATTDLLDTPAVADETPVTMVEEEVLAEATPVIAKTEAESVQKKATAMERLLKFGKVVKQKDVVTTAEQSVKTDVITSEEKIETTDAPIIEDGKNEIEAMAASVIPEEMSATPATEHIASIEPKEIAIEEVVESNANVTESLVAEIPERKAGLMDRLKSLRKSIDAKREGIAHEEAQIVDETEVPSEVSTAKKAKRSAKRFSFFPVKNTSEVAGTTDAPIEITSASAIEEPAMEIKLEAEQLIKEETNIECITPVVIVKEVSAESALEEKPAMIENLVSEIKDVTGIAEAESTEIVPATAELSSKKAKRFSFFPKRKIEDALVETSTGEKSAVTETFSEVETTPLVQEVVREIECSTTRATEPMAIPLVKPIVSNPLTSFLKKVTLKRPTKMAVSQDTSLPKEAAIVEETLVIAEEPLVISEARKEAEKIVEIVIKAVVQKEEGTAPLV